MAIEVDGVSPSGELDRDISELRELAATHVPHNDLWARLKKVQKGIPRELSLEEAAAVQQHLEALEGLTFSSGTQKQLHEERINNDLMRISLNQPDLINSRLADIMARNGVHGTPLIDLDSLERVVEFAGDKNTQLLQQNCNVHLDFDRLLGKLALHPEENATYLDLELKDDLTAIVMLADAMVAQDRVEFVGRLKDSGVLGAMVELLADLDFPEEDLSRLYVRRRDDLLGESNTLYRAEVAVYLLSALVRLDPTSDIVLREQFADSTLTVNSPWIKRQLDALCSDKEEDVEQVKIELIKLQPEASYRHINRRLYDIVDFSLGEELSSEERQERIAEKRANEEEELVRKVEAFTEQLKQLPIIPFLCEKEYVSELFRLNRIEVVRERNKNESAN